MNNLTIIIPIHEYNEQIENYLDKAILSIEKQEGIENLPQIIIVHSKSIENEISKNIKDKYLDKFDFNLLVNNGKTDYQSQVNLAVKSVTTDYFSVLEFDDEYSNTFFKNINKYTDYYNDIDVYLPIIIEVDNDNNGVKFTNESVWAQQFVGENGEIGYLNTNTLNQYTDFKLSGSAIKTSKFIEIGGYKSNIELTFMYEFLLRALNNGCKIFTLPKISYKHLTTRENSLFNYYLNNMNPNERKFWFETAKKEFNYMGDREIDKTKINKSIIVQQ